MRIYFYNAKVGEQRMEATPMETNAWKYCCDGLSISFRISGNRQKYFH